MTKAEFNNDINDWADLINFCRDQDLDYCNDIISNDDMDEYVRNELESSDWQRVFFFLRDISDYRADYFRIDGYGNAENLDSSDFASYKSDVAEYADFDEEEEEFDYSDVEGTFAVTIAAMANTQEVSKLGQYNSKQEAVDAATREYNLDEEEAKELFRDESVIVKGAMNGRTAMVCIEEI